MSHLDRKKIDELWKLYQEDPRPTTIAKRAGVHWRTVDRYIKYGNKVAGIEAFSVRLKRITDAVDKKTIDHAAKDLELVQRILNTATNELFKTEEKNGKIVIVGMKEAPRIADIDKLLRLKYFLSGEPDSRSETRIKGDVNRVVTAVIAIITRHVKDQVVKNLIADELVSLINVDGDIGGPEKSRLTH